MNRVTLVSCRHDWNRITKVWFSKFFGNPYRRGIFTNGRARVYEKWYGYNRLVLRIQPRCFCLQTCSIPTPSAQGAYAKGFLPGKEQPLLISANFKHLLTYFPAANFHRLSRSVLINLDHVERLEHDYLLLGTHKTPIPLSVASRKELLKRINIVRAKKTLRTDT